MCSNNLDHSFGKHPKIWEAAESQSGTAQNLSQAPFAQILLTCTKSMTLNKVFKLYVPQFLYLYNGYNDRTYFVVNNIK